MAMSVSSTPLVFESVGFSAIKSEYASRNLLSALSGDPRNKYEYPISDRIALCLALDLVATASFIASWYAPSSSEYCPVSASAVPNEVRLSMYQLRGSTSLRMSLASVRAARASLGLFCQVLIKQ